TGITTIYDFRSDDLMQGGEGAPLAPMHNRHIAEQLREEGYVPMTFINAGNTSNIAHVTEDGDGKLVTVGWDAGPCNHFPDLLMQTEGEMQCDRDGNIGKKGRINRDLLRELFAHAATTPHKANFLDKKPPKSSDPQWYRAPDMLLDKTLPFEDRLRTAEYFSAYLLFHSLGYTDRKIELPFRFALFGGGWNNPIIREHFSALLKGDFSSSPVLAEHKGCFEALHQRLQGKQLIVSGSETYGFDGQAMEARIFADMARCRIIGEPFTTPHITGGEREVVCGIIRYPSGTIEKATPNLRAWVQEYQVHPSYGEQKQFDSRWSRAVAGWSTLAHLKEE
ncbi:MAG TPA: anhydro-N-acetylmuramic acid kinase, partial [Ktedonobacteraceae bacterium]|nr:anhydro-N-acetylmuramic acid kinase [Ktedonobacteraceae bacterium]